MTGKAYAFVDGIGPDADTGATRAPNNQGQLADFDTPADVDAKIAAALATAEAYTDAAIAAFALTLANQFTYFACFATPGSARYANGNPLAIGSATALNYPTTARRALSLRCYFTTNTLTTAAVTVTVLKNGIATALTLVQPAMTTGLATITANVDFASNDTLDVLVTCAAGGAGSSVFGVTVTWSPIKP